MSNITKGLMCLCLAGFVAACSEPEPEIVTIAPSIDKLISSYDGVVESFHPKSLDDFHPDQLFEQIVVGNGTLAPVQKVRQRYRHGSPIHRVSTRQGAVSRRGR